MLSRTRNGRLSALLTGARDGAIASMKLKHIALIRGKVEQDARQVKTKFRKTFATYFFPVGDDIRQIVTDWVHYLRLSGLDDPLSQGRELPWGPVVILKRSDLTETAGATPADRCHFQGCLYGGGPALF
jgi:hypothetical protein